MAKSNYGSDIKRKMKRDRNKRIIRTLVEVVLVLLASAAVAFLFFSSVMIQENSMSPTLMAGDRVFINRVVYAIGSVHRGDLIAYRGSGGTDSGIHVKRVIGLPGETVTIRDGLIQINGTTYMEAQEFPSINNAGMAGSGVTLGSNEYFVLGDNRNNSEDSRYADVGNIRSKDVVGRIWYRSAPAGRRERLR